MNVKMIYDENFRFRSWLRKIEDKNKILAESKKFMRKPRKGNIFMILGANGYCGWATIAQLAFQYSGCTIICCDKEIGVREGSVSPMYPLHVRLNELHKYFSFQSVILNDDFEVKEIFMAAIERYKPHFIINLADGYSEFYNPVMINALHCLKEIGSAKIHFIQSTSYGTVTDFNYFATFPITELKTGKVMAPFNMPTLINSKLAPFSSKESFLNKLILRVIEKPEIKYKEQTMISVSLEMFTRTIAEIIRTGVNDRQKNYKFYRVAEQDLNETLILHIIKLIMKKLDNISLKMTRTQNKKSAYMFDRGGLLKLLNEFNPPLHTFISYSYKYIKDNKEVMDGTKILS